MTTLLLNLGNMQLCVRIMNDNASYSKSHLYIYIWRQDKVKLDLFLLVFTNYDLQA